MLSQVRTFTDSEIHSAASALDLATEQLKNPDVFDQWSPPAEWSTLHDEHLHPMWSSSLMAPKSEGALKFRLSKLFELWSKPSRYTKTHPLDHPWVIEWTKAWLDAKGHFQRGYILQQMHLLLHDESWSEHPNAKVLATALYPHVRAQSVKSEEYFQWWYLSGGQYQHWGFDVPPPHLLCDSEHTTPSQKALLLTLADSDWLDMPWAIHSPHARWKSLMALMDESCISEWLVQAVTRGVGDTLSMHDHPDVLPLKAYYGIPFSEDERRCNPELYQLSCRAQHQPHKALPSTLIALHSLSANALEFMAGYKQLHTATSMPVVDTSTPETADFTP